MTGVATQTVPPPGSSLDDGITAGSANLMHDFFRAIRHVRLWRFLGWRALCRQYDRTWVGPLWIPLSALVHMTFVGFVFSKIFPGERFVPHFVLGYAVWSVIARGINESVRLWKGAEKYIRHLNIPISVFLIQLVFQATVRLVLTLPLAVLISIGFGARPGWVSLLVFPGAIVVMANLAWALTILSVICMRLRDLASFMPNLVFMAYLMTPIIWQPERLGEHEWVVLLNPFYHLIELLRAPLQGDFPEPVSWVVAGLGVLIGGPIAYMTLAASRRRIVLWM